MLVFDTIIIMFSHFSANYVVTDALVRYLTEPVALPSSEIILL